MPIGLHIHSCCTIYYVFSRRFHNVCRRCPISRLFLLLARSFCTFRALIDFLYWLSSRSLVAFWLLDICDSLTHHHLLILNRLLFLLYINNLFCLQYILYLFFGAYLYSRASLSCAIRTWSSANLRVYAFYEPNIHISIVYAIVLSSYRRCDHHIKCIYSRKSRQRRLYFRWNKMHIL